MKYFAFLVVLLLSLLQYSQATICARDGRSGGPQNFPSRGAMNAENGRGGRKFLYFLFISYNGHKISITNRPKFAW